MDGADPAAALSRRFTADHFLVAEQQLHSCRGTWAVYCCDHHSRVPRKLGSHILCPAKWGGQGGSFITSAASRCSEFCFSEPQLFLFSMMGVYLTCFKVTGEA